MWVDAAGFCWESGGPAWVLLWSLDGSNCRTFPNQGGYEAEGSPVPVRCVAREDTKAARISPAGRPHLHFAPMFRALLIFAFLAVAIASPTPNAGPADVISAVGVIKDKCTVLDNGVKGISSPATGTQILNLEVNVLGVQNALKSAQQTLTGATLSTADCATWSDAVHGTVPIISTTLSDFNAKKSALPSAVKVVVCSNAKSLQSSCDTYMNSAKGLCPERKDQWVSDQAALDQSFKGLLDPSGFNCA
ncbi:unnamed protein product [Mycena citricolor]|uniref:Uncharacterized protein n=1 Tax=Mycena citricolor TaxID=2018698 RepID=A0AAD2HAW8_9AGAR|nr:unnamed protein product [Mycena citricolor]